MSDNSKTPSPAAQRVAQLTDVAGTKGRQALGFIQARPKLAALAAVACLGVGYYATREPVTKLTSIAPAVGYPAPAGNGQQMKLVVTDKKGEASFTVASARLTNGRSGPKLLLNDATDFRQARQTVVVDLTKCPGLAVPDARAYLGKHVTAKGSLGSYDGRPQVQVDDPGDVTIK